MEWADSGVAVPKSIPVLQAEIKALEREIYVDEQGAPILEKRKAARSEHLGEDGGGDIEKLTAYRNFLKAEVSADKNTGEIAEDSPRVWSTDDLERLWKERSAGLSPERRTVIEGDMGQGGLTESYIAELCEELNKLDPEPA